MAPPPGDRSNPQMPRLLLLQGPNLTYLGKREPHLYGTQTAKELDAEISAYAKERGAALEIVYTHIEGEAIQMLYDRVEAGAIDGLMMNPAGFTYAGYALKDCLKAIQVPYVEIHITNVEARGIRSILAEIADGVIFGLGTYGYRLALDAVLHVIAERASSASR